MSVLIWCLIFAASSVLALWVMRWGGAEWMERWGLSDSLYSTSWNAEQIKLYFLLLWLLHVVWFVVGLLVPAARGLR